MKIDWKALAKTKGYKSLKASYIYDMKGNCFRKKGGDYFRKFQWVINRAKHYAYHKNVSIETVLNGWEEKRSYWWLNYYQDCNQPKIYKVNRYKTKNKPKGKIKPRWTKAYRKNYR